MGFTQLFSQRAGFTFAEMLIVTVMMAVISLAIYAALSNGVRIWQRVNQNNPNEDLIIFLDKFSRDLRNSFKFTGISFIGEEDQLEFTTLVNSTNLKIKTVGKVSYRYSTTSETLIRQQKDFSQAYLGSNTPTQKLDGVVSLQFKYYLFDTEIGEYYFTERWSKTQSPLAVRIELEFNDGTKNRKITKTVSLPVNG